MCVPICLLEMYGLCRESFLLLGAFSLWARVHVRYGFNLEEKNNKAKLNIIVSVVGDFSPCFFSLECWEHVMGEWFSCSTQIQVNTETKTRKNE